MYLCVFIDEHKSIGYIMIAQMNNRRSNPAAYPLLTTLQNTVHFMQNLKSIAVKSLTIMSTINAHNKIVNDSAIQASSC